jgi:phospholipid N-methyltransferase
METKDFTATYSPDDNKLRLYPAYRLDSDLYVRVKAAGFKWAPKQQLFVAPAWSPAREDLLIELCGEIEDEDKSLVDRAETRAERFQDYSVNRRNDAAHAHNAVAAIADNIPLGQPILVGHHSEKRARRDAEKIQNGMRKAVKLWDQSRYWSARAAGAIGHAKYLERPDVRARRIKKLEAENRRAEKEKNRLEQLLEFWTQTEITMEAALHICNVYDHGGVILSDGEHYWSGWSALTDGKITVDHIRTQRLKSLPENIAHYGRWISHYENRLMYERAMLDEAGGTIADKTGPEVGGGCRCWASPTNGWSYIQKVNRVSVTVLRNWGNGGRDFTETIPFDKLKAIMTKAQVEAAREAGTLMDMPDGKLGFYLMESSPEISLPPTGQPSPLTEFDAMRDSLKAGVQIVSVPQLFPTPPDVASLMVDTAEINSDHRILEPSAGTGNIIKAIGNQPDKVAVEIHPELVTHLMRCGVSGLHIIEGDFLEQDGDLGVFDRIIMNPPFENGSDINHIKHALTFLKPGGRLVALCANGPRQQKELQPLADEWQVLPDGSFKPSGTNVTVALLVISNI